MSSSPDRGEHLTRLVVAAVHDLLAESHAALREAVTGLSAEALAWRPEVAESNSIAALVSHALESERFLIAMALDRRVERDRDAQFRRVVDDASELLREIEAADAALEALLSAIGADHLMATVARSSVRTGAAWLLRAAVHTREHAGQALLTRDLALAALGRPERP